MKHPIYILSVISKDDFDMEYTHDLNIACKISIEMIENFKKHIDLNNFEKDPTKTLNNLMKDLEEHNEIDIYIHDNDFKNDLDIVFRDDKLNFVMSITNKYGQKKIYRLHLLDDISKL